MFLFSCSVRHLQTHSSCLTIPPWPGEFSIAIRNDSRDVRRFFDSKHKVSILGVYFACEFVRLWRWAYICEWVCVFIDPFVLCIFKWRTGTCCSISVLRNNMIRRNSRGVHRSVYLQYGLSTAFTNIILTLMHKHSCRKFKLLATMYDPMYEPQMIMMCGTNRVILREILRPLVWMQHVYVACE